MNADDQEAYKAAVTREDGTKIGLSEIADMVIRMIAYEYMRLTRAVSNIPPVRLVETYACSKCSKTHHGDHDGPCGGENCLPSGEVATCQNDGPFELTDAFVTFGDEAVERKESHIASLIRLYNEITDGERITIESDVPHRYPKSGETVTVAPLT
jgi:hypothetical protein